MFSWGVFVFCLLPYFYLFVCFHVVVLQMVVFAKVARLFRLLLMRLCYVAVCSLVCLHLLMISSVFGVNSNVPNDRLLPQLLLQIFRVLAIEKIEIL